jgi:threonine/homoserine/homoserine lactone efflux protein
MDDVTKIAQGFAIGFLVSIGSYGPLFMIFARETLTHGRLLGFIAGLGIAAGDAVAAAIAVVALALVNDFVKQNDVLVRVVTGLIFCGVGVWLAVVGIPKEVRQPSASTITGAFLSTFGLTLATPSGVPYIAGLFIVFNVPISFTSVQGLLLLAVGVFVGGAVVRLGETLLLGAARERVSLRVVRGASLVAAAVMFVIGLYGIASAFLGIGPRLV